MIKKWSHPSLISLLPEKTIVDHQTTWTLGAPNCMLCIISHSPKLRSFLSTGRILVPAPPVVPKFAKAQVLYVKLHRTMHIVPIFSQSWITGFTFCFFNLFCDTFRRPRFKQASQKLFNLKVRESEDMK